MTALSFRQKNSATAFVQHAFVRRARSLPMRTFKLNQKIIAQQFMIAQSHVLLEVDPCQATFIEGVNTGRFRALSRHCNGRNCTALF